MAINTTLASCNVNAALNGPDGATDLPSALDDAIRNALSFIAQLRDGVQVGGGALWMTGMVAAFPTTTTPTGWLKLNGQAVSRTTYASLFAFANAAGLVSEAVWSGGSYGNFSVGDGSSTFRVPDLRAMILRGLDEGRGIDVGRALGVFQDGAILQHAHGVNDGGHTHVAVSDSQGSHNHTITDPGHSHGRGEFNGANNIGGGVGAFVRLNNGTPSVNTDSSGTGISINSGGAHVHTITVSPAGTGISIQNAGGAENRMKNIPYPWYVKY